VANSRRGLTLESFTRAETFEYISLYLIPSALRSAKWQFCKVNEQISYRQSFSLELQAQTEAFENTALCLRLAPHVHGNPSQKRSFSKMLFKPEKFENAGFVSVFVWTEKR